MREDMHAPLAIAAPPPRWAGQMACVTSKSVERRERWDGPGGPKSDMDKITAPPDEGGAVVAVTRRDLLQRDAVLPDIRAAAKDVRAELEHLLRLSGELERK